MSKPEWVFNRDDDQQGIARELADGVSARIFGGVEAMLSVVRLEAHSASDLHSHDEEQWGILLEGECTRIQDGAEVSMSVGDFWHTPSNVPHAMRTGELPALVLDVFSPPRPQYRPGSGSTSGTAGPAAQAAAGFGAAVLCDSAGSHRALPSSIRSIAGGGQIRGPAFPVACAPGDNLWLHRAVYSAAAGDVLVVSTGGFHEAGYWGDVLTHAARERGLGGLVIDGRVRDRSALEGLGFPVFATGLCIRSTSKTGETVGSMGEPIRIGESTIERGDSVVGDSDGVVVLPRRDLATILAEAKRREDREADILRRLSDGERTIDLFGIAQSS